MQRKFGVKVLLSMKINSDHLSCQFVKNARLSRAVSDYYTYDLYYVKLYYSRHFVVNSPFNVKIVCTRYFHKFSTFGYQSTNLIETLFSNLKKSSLIFPRRHRLHTFVKD